MITSPDSEITCPTDELCMKRAILNCYYIGRVFKLQPGIRNSIYIIHATTM